MNTIQNYAEPNTKLSFLHLFQQTRSHFCLYSLLPTLSEEPSQSSSPGSNPSISPAYSGLPVLRWSAQCRTTLMCPAEEDSGMLILSVVVSINMCGREGGKRGQWGLSKGTKKMRQLTMSMGSARAQFAASYKEPPFPVRGLSFYVSKHHKCN